ncbi:MAG: hypothetical protein HQK75_13020 [Candidatus Magnetomorum sp.]|nr:hypothetical protein [Candidatus Magnetomorum sp.]
MSHKPKRIIYFFYFCLLISLSLIQSTIGRTACDDLFNREYPININNSIEGLKLLTGHTVQISELRQWDINHNGQVNISDVLYPFLIQSQMITYEIQKKNECHYLLKGGKSFISIEALTNGHDLYIHPDGHTDHAGFSWMLLPFISETIKPAMETNRLDSGIELSFFAGTLGNDQLSGSFNLNLSFSYDDAQKVVGQGNLQIMLHTSDILESLPLYLFKIDSTNIQPVKISGKIDQQPAAFFWTPSLEEAGKKLGGFSPLVNMLVAGNTLASYPDFDLTVSSSYAPIYFNGHYDDENKCFSIQPFMNIIPGQNQYSIDFYFNASLPNL